MDVTGNNTFISVPFPGHPDIIFNIGDSQSRDPGQTGKEWIVGMLIIKLAQKVEELKISYEMLYEKHNNLVTEISMNGSKYIRSYDEEVVK